MHKTFNTGNAPLAIGPYSQAAEVNGLLFVAGQIPVVPETGKIIEGGIREQTRQVLLNIGKILTHAGYTYSDVFKSTCFLMDITDFQAMNEIYEEFYSENKPARSAFAVKDLPGGALIEIETIAAKPAGSTQQ